MTGRKYEPCALLEAGRCAGRPPVVFLMVAGVLMIGAACQVLRLAIYTKIVQK